MFESANITEYKLENSNRRITKISNPGMNEFVFMNRKFSESGCSQISVRIVSNPLKSGISIGAAIESPNMKGELLYRDGWIIYSGNRVHYEKGSSYSGGASLAEGQIVTVRVDVASKTIIYLVDGVPTGPARTMNISDADIMNLKPAVQICFIGDGAEIV